MKRLIAFLSLGLLCFAGSSIKQPIVEPKPGEIWALNELNGDPFEAKLDKTVQVLEIKRGWVRYAIGSLFPDERMAAEIFVKVYRKVK